MRTIIAIARPVIVAVAVAAIAALVPRVARAADSSSSPTALAAAPAGLRADAEIDLTAYLLEGYSVHVGVGWRHLRVDLGAFGMALPRAVHGAQDFELSFDGFGVKLQYFPFAEQAGGFVGVDSGVVRALVERVGTEQASRQTQLSAGVHLGWRFVFGQRFYATPWLGVSYTLGARDVTLAGSTYEPSRIVVFPAVHLGYRFL